VAHYLLFVDDSGNREYDRARNYTDSGRTRHFVYGSILGEADALSRFATRLQELKVATFGTADVEVKSTWLRIPKEREARYLTRFGITDDALTLFTDGCYEVIRRAPIELLAVVIDKLHMQEEYPAPYYPPTVAYEYLLQRAAQALPADATLAVTVDDISGKTPKHNEYKELLRRHHEQLRQRGSRHQPRISFACLRTPVRFMLSQHSDLIQAADIVAYNVYRQFRDHGDDWEQQGPQGRTLPMYPYFSRISSKFRRHPSGRVQGFGIVKVPLRQRVHWAVSPREGS